jgi:hypothetical protein
VTRDPIVNAVLKIQHFALAIGAAECVTREGNDSVLYNIAKWKRREAVAPICQQIWQTAVLQRGEGRNGDGNVHSLVVIALVVAVVVWFQQAADKLANRLIKAVRNTV